MAGSATDTATKKLSSGSGASNFAHIHVYIRLMAGDFLLFFQFEVNMNNVIHGDCITEIKTIADNSVHLILSDIPYGIGFDNWDILYNNTNSALLGSSPAQEKASSVFKKRGKPLNGWSEADKRIPIEYYNWCMTWAPEWLRVLTPGASAFVFAGRRLAHRCIAAMEDAGFVFKDMIAWEKESAPHRVQRISAVYDRRNDEENAKRWTGWRVGNLRPLFEPILWFMKPYTIGGTLADNIIDHGVGAYNDAAWRSHNPLVSNQIQIKSTPDDHGKHPTQKPLALMRALIELTTVENQVVLDPFCGSGSTLVAAKQLNRQYIGIEISEEFCRTANKRLNAIAR